MTSRPSYLSLSPDTPLSVTEAIIHKETVGQFILRANRLRKIIQIEPDDSGIIQSEPDDSGNMIRFRMLVDFAELFKRDDACHKFKEYIEFQNEYADFKKWKANRNKKLDNQSNHLYPPGLPRDNARQSTVNDHTSIPYYNNWMSGGNGHRNVSEISRLFNTAPQEPPKMYFDDESDIDDFEDLDTEAYEKMLQEAYSNVTKKSRLRQATMGERKFYTNIEIPDDDDDENVTSGDVDDVVHSDDQDTTNDMTM